MNKENIRKTATILAFVAALGIGTYKQGKSIIKNQKNETHYFISDSDINYNVERLENSLLGDFHITEIISYEPLKVKDYYAKKLDGTYYIYEYIPRNTNIYSQVGFINNDVNLINEKKYEKKPISIEKKEELAKVLNENFTLTLK